MLRTIFQLRSRGHSPDFFSNYVRFGANAGKQTPENVGAGVVVRLLAVYGGDLCGCDAVLAMDWMLCPAVRMRYLTWLR